MLYNVSSIENYKENIKKGIIKMIVSFLVTVLLLVSLIFFINCDTNDTLILIFKILAMVLFAIIGWYILYTLFDTVLFYNNKIKVLDGIERANKKEIEGTIIEIGKIITISKYEKAYIIQIKANKDTLSCYYSTDFNNMPFIENKNYHLTLAKNTIIDYKEQN